MQFDISLAFFLGLLVLTFFPPESKILESSVWCDRRSCRFKNICYDSGHRSFLFFLTDKSVIKGIDHYSDFQKIQTSSIDHNKFFANITMVNPLKITKRVMKKGILISRFKPDNIMHCIHDDLFPLFLTLEKNCMGDLDCLKDFVILLHDNHPKGNYFELYKYFNQVLFLTEDLCFETVITGISQDSLFFQYGFGQPHGPLNPKIHQNDVLRFKNFLLSNINYEEKTDIIFLSRRKTRKIVNKDFVLSSVQTFYEKTFSKKNPSYISADLNSNSLTYLIEKISKADLLIGMHGAEMILGMFMKPKSILIELFPFGIRENISFINPLMNVEGSEQVYISWRNHHRINSIFPDNAHPMFGGIQHLPEDLRKKIKNLQEIPAVECCDDPAYLHYMYQDTIVGDDFKDMLKNFRFENKKNKKFFQKWFFPSPVSNLNCILDSPKKALKISWDPPFNVENTDQITYSIFISGELEKFRKEIQTNETGLKIEINSDERKFKLWILANYLDNEAKSVDQFYECV